MLEVGLFPIAAPLFSLNLDVTDFQCHLRCHLSMRYHLSPRGHSCLRKGYESFQEVVRPPSLEVCRLGA